MTAVAHAELREGSEAIADAMVRWLRREVR